MQNKRKRFLSVWLCMQVMLLLLTACGGGERPVPGEASPAYTFWDDTGEEVILPQRPRKIAVLFSSYADIWVCAGGRVDITVGETVERGFAGEEAVLVDEGAGHSSIDLEALINAAPDFVVGTADYAVQAEAVDICRAAGIPSALFHVETFDDYLHVLEIFCGITGEAARYVEYGEKVEQKIDGMLASVDEWRAEQGDDLLAPRILFVRAGTSDKSTKAKTTEDNFVCAMLRELGAVNIADSSREIIDSFSLDAIVDRDPDHLFITLMGNEAAATEHMTELLSRAGWRELDCVKNQRYTFLPKDLFHFKPNARWDEAYAYLIEILYPEVSLE